MCKSSFDVIEGVGWLLRGIAVVIFLIIFIEIDEVCIVVIAMLSLQTVASKMSLLSTLEAGIVPSAMRWSLSIGYVSSGRISSSPTPPIIRGLGSVKIHRDWLVIQPSRGVGGVILGLLLSLSSSPLSKSLVTVPSSSSVL